MPEVCPHCNREYKNTKALGSHIRHMHKDVNTPPPPPPPPLPPPLEEDESTKSPPEGKGASMTPLDAQQQFQGLLERWDIKHADAIADFMASQDG